MEAVRGWVWIFSGNAQSCFVLDSDIKPVRVPHCLKRSNTSVLVSWVITENIHTIPQPAFWKSEGMGVNDY